MNGKIQVLPRRRRRPNTPNVIFRISFWWPIHIINPVDQTKWCCNTPHRRSTTVSLETYPLYSFVSIMAFLLFNISAICLDSSADLELVSLLVKCLDISRTPGVDHAVSKTFRTKCILALSICVDQCGKDLGFLHSNFKSSITWCARQWMINSEHGEISNIQLKNILNMTIVAMSLTVIFYQCISEVTQSGHS